MRDQPQGILRSFKVYIYLPSRSRSYTDVRRLRHLAGIVEKSPMPSLAAAGSCSYKFSNRRSRIPAQYHGYAELDPRPQHINENGRDRLRI